MDPIDFRSDTVTLPTEAMYDAMRIAPLGDDVFGDDPTVHALEETARTILGKEAALFVPSGTMANSIAIAVATRPGDEIVVMEDSHVFLFEQGGAARLWGVQARALATTDGCPDLEQIRNAVRPDDPHFPRTSLVCVENTHNMRGGVPFSPERMASVGATCRELGLTLHLDGARLFNAAAALGCDPRELTRPADSVMISLSKGLRCPAGSIYAADAARVAEARRVRKVLGGGMRQAGILAACGCVALADPLTTLREDHRRARELAVSIDALSGLRVAPSPPATNILMVELVDHDADRLGRLAAALGEQGLRVVNILNQRLRLVTHGGLDDDAIARAADGFGRAWTAVS